MRLVQSQFQASSAKLGQFATSSDNLKLKATSLSQQLQLQTQKVDALKRAVQSSIETKGADARITQDLTIKLHKAEAAMSKYITSSSIPTMPSSARTASGSGFPITCSMRVNG